ncbi:hypothetical protein ACS0TY_009357 [Phlomoides rotata]
MAARRVISLLSARISQNPHPTATISSPRLAELSRKFSPSPYTFSRDYEQYTRGFQSLAETTIPSVQNPSQDESCSSNSNLGPDESISNPENDQITVKHQVNSNLKVSERHDVLMVFTCGVCDTRAIKSFRRESYDKGVVLVRCDGCNKTHLIADRLGWFGEPGSVEEFLAARGEEVKKGSTDTLELTLEDLAGKKNLDIQVE